jgi:hypothetical protein
VVVEGAVVLIGVALLVLAVVLNVRWLDAHVLPDMFRPRQKLLIQLGVARATAAVLGLLLLVIVRPLAGRYAAKRPLAALLADIGATALAMVLALGASELILRSVVWRAAHEAPADREPLRRRDPTFGWLVVPNRAGLGPPLAGRRVQYAYDRTGYRVRRPGDAVDPEWPTIIFVGESIMGGFGLSWDESIPAQVEAMTGVQSANLTVDAYANDQAYMRLRAELPKFRRPVAVVSVFVPSLFYRSLDDDRPHLEPGLVWTPAAHGWRLAEILRRAAPVRSQAEIDRGVALNREIFAATVRLAHARGAQALIVAPQLTPETPAERMLRRRVLDETGLPYVYAPVDPSWHIPGNKHPNARAAHAIAVMVADRLRAASVVDDTSVTSRPLD